MVAPAVGVTSTSVQDTAKRGLTAISRAQDASEQRGAGDRFLAAVAKEAGATDLEKLVAATTRTCTDRRLASSSAVNAQRVALTALSAGVGGPVGITLATLGQKVLSGGYDTEDQRAMAPTWLAALEKHGTASEKLLAEAARLSTSQRLANSSAVGGHSTALSMAAAGLQGSGEVVVATFGRNALARAYDEEDQRTMGRQVLGVLARVGGDPALDAVAASANAATGQRLANTSAVSAQLRALDVILSPPASDADTLLASLGRQALSGAYDQEDARALGGKLLDGIVQDGKNPIAVALAAAARKATHRQLANQSAAGLHRAAFDRIVGGFGTDTLEVSLARLGLSARSCAYDTEDARRMGGGVLDEIGARTTDAQVAALVQYAKQYTGASVDDSQAVRIQEGILDSIVKGNMTVPAPPAAGAATSPASAARIDARVMIPKVDEEAPPEEQIKVLEAALAHNQNVVLEMDAAAQKASAEIAALQPKKQPLVERINALAEKDQTLVARINRLHRVRGFATLGMVGGWFTYAASHSPVAGALAAVGVVTAVVTHLAKQNQEFKRQRLHLEYSGATLDLDLIVAQESVYNAEASAARSVAGQAEKAMADARGRLDVLRMARAVNQPGPDPNARVTVEEQAVTIGGIRVPKKAAAPE